MTLAHILNIIRLDFRRPSPANPLMVDPTYAALTQEIDDARARHRQVRKLERQRSELIHASLRRLRVDPDLSIPRRAA